MLSCRPFLRVASTLTLLLVAACGGGGGPASPSVPPPQAPAQYRVGGTVTGLTGTGLRLINKRDNTLDVSANGAFSFARTATAGTPYAVTVSVHPTSPDGLCTVANGTGTVGTSDISNIVVTCVENPAVTMQLNFTANNAQEAFLYATTTGNVNNLRFEARIDGVLIWCCSIWGAGQPDGFLQPARPHQYYLGAWHTPFSPGTHVYEAKLLDAAGNVVASSTTSGGTTMQNALTNGGATDANTNGWVVDSGGAITTKTYSDSRSALYRLLEPLPFERLGISSGGSYFSSEGTANGGGVMHQRVTVAFPGFSDGQTTAMAIGGWLGSSAGAVSEIQYDYIGENPNGTPRIVATSTLRSLNTDGKLERVYRYGLIPAGVHYVDVTLTLRGNGGAAFADNLYVSVLPWPR